MRRRIVLATVAVLVAALVAFAVPLAVAVRGLVVSRALDGLQAQAEQVAQIVDERARTCGEVDMLLGIASRERPAALSLFTPRGRLVAVVAGHDPSVGVELERARRGVTGRRHGGGSLAVAVPLSTDACGQPLVLHAEESDAAVQASVHRSWLALGGVGAGVFLLAAGVGVLVSRRVTRPLDDLAGAAAALGDGDFSARAPRSGLPEVDRIAETLDDTADRLGRAIDRARTFAADASHQLRTPMTALRLHLEGLQARGDAPAEVEQALREADRLEATVSELVTLSSLDRTEERIDARDLVEPPVASARAAAAHVGRAVELDVVVTRTVVTRPAAVRQACQVLLDNALQHGRGTITVTLAPTLPDQPDRGLRISVLDEGEGPGQEALEVLRARDRGAALPLAGGRGLALARLLVEGEGGRLTADEVDGRVRMTIILPQVATTA